MKIISSTRFSKVGTNPNKYINNYLIYLNQFDLGSIFVINDFSVKEMGIEIFSCNSRTTFRQNIQCWISLGFFICKDNKLIKIIPKINQEKLFKYIRGILLVESSDENINIYRNTCLIKILHLSNIDIFKNTSIKMREKKLEISDIEEETGEFEKILIEDKDFVNIVKIMWGINEN